MSKLEPVAVQISDGVVADSILPVSRRLNDFDAVGAVKLIELVRVSDDKEHCTAFGAGSAPLQEHLHSIEIHPGHRRRLAKGEGQEEAKLVFVEVGSCLDVADRQTGVEHFAFDVRGCRRHRTPLECAGLTALWSAATWRSQVFAE